MSLQQIFKEFSNGCDLCTSTGCGTHAKIYPRPIHGKYLRLCGDCWNKKVDIEELTTPKTESTMTQKERADIEQEVKHIFNSGANETRINEMIIRHIHQRDRKKAQKLQYTELHRSIQDQVVDFIKSLENEVHHKKNEIKTAEQDLIALQTACQIQEETISRLSGFYSEGGIHED